MSGYVESISRNVLFWLGLVLFIFGVFFGEFFENFPFPSFVFPVVGFVLIIVGIFYRLVKLFKESKK